MNTRWKDESCFKAAKFNDATAKNREGMTKTALRARHSGDKS